jgi:hypothetical protein
MLLPISYSNSSEKYEQTPIKWEGARDSVMTIMFNHFGGGPYPSDEDPISEFDVHEKIRLAQAVRATAGISRLMQEAAQSKFKDHLELIKRWFGVDPEDSDFADIIKYVVKRVNRMHRVLSDNTKQIRFIDTRNQRRVNFKTKYKKIMSFNSENEWCVHGEKAVVSGEWIQSISKHAYVFQQGPYFRDKFSTRHVGSGYRVYIGPKALEVRYRESKICKMLYHEMSHKILGTDDVDAYGNNIYGKDDCQTLAKESRYQALKIADCWAFFFMEFYHPRYF